MPWWQNIAFSSPSSSSSTSSSRRRLTRARKLRHVRGNHIDALVRSRSSAEPKDLLPLPLRLPVSTIRLSACRPWCRIRCRAGIGSAFSSQRRLQFEFEL
ncbi:hypothetical protein CK203_101768 [Vitis vinifera]|uniref:Uncharacterized protein n=1 Tax=Vitis vinifera TaxID=29760 RepID=A0A438FB25_VITVI|nr:hypothetical protein CK203_101768 [Vitis vinifera]